MCGSRCECFRRPRGAAFQVLPPRLERPLLYELLRVMPDFGGIFAVAIPAVKIGCKILPRCTFRKACFYRTKKTRRTLHHFFGMFSVFRLQNVLHGNAARRCFSSPHNPRCRSNFFVATGFYLQCSPKRRYRRGMVSTVPRSGRRSSMRALGIRKKEEKEEWIKTSI